MASDRKADAMQVRRLLNMVALDPESIASLSISDLDLALRLARRVRLLGRLGAGLESAELLDTLPATAVDQLRSGIAMAEVRSRLALWELNRISLAMRSNPSAPLVVLKGCTYLLLDLPNAAGRIFADVDLMTTENDLERVESLLNDHGWISGELTPYDQNYYRKWTHELPPITHEEREVEIDLHHNIMPRTARLNPSSEKLLERSQPVPGSPYRVLSDEDIVLHAMVHLMFDSDLADKLRDLVDIHDLLTYFSNRDKTFWDKIVERSVDLDLARPLYYSIRYAHMLLDTQVPDQILDKTSNWAPPNMIVRLMDRLVPRALYPQHPDRPSRFTDFCRLLLYMRSHWIRMPPWLLVYHLSYKFLATRLRRPPVEEVG